MENTSKISLTNGQLVGLLVGFVLGPGFLKLPNILIDKALQDSWIASIVALIVPIYIVLVSCYIAVKHPKENLLQINKVYFGNILGNIINVIFFTQFLFYTNSIISEFNMIARLYIIAFLTPGKITLACLIIATYTSTRGLKTLAKTSETVLWFLIPVFLLSAFIFKEGDFLNIQPVFSSGVPNILRASLDTMYFYTGFEYLLIIHPHIKEIDKVRKNSLIAVAICGVIWVWSVFGTIYYAGIDIAARERWSFFLVYNAVYFPIINNVRYVFMFAWCLASFRIIANYIFLSTFTLGSIIKLKNWVIYSLLCPLYYFLSMQLLKGNTREKVLDIFSPIFVGINIALITIIALITVYKNNKSESSD